MVVKLNRKYKLTVQTEVGGDIALEIANPLTIEFSIIRNTFASSNTGTFKIRNLSETSRNTLFQSRTDIVRRQRIITLEAGYGTTPNKDDDLSTIFVGNIVEGYSFRQGPDVVTYLNCLDSGLATYTATTTAALTEGIDFKDLMKTLIGSLKGKGVGEGAVGDVKGRAKRGVAINGNTFNLMKKYADKDTEVFIDLNKINVLNVNEYIESSGGKVLLFNSETGLLGTPLRQGSFLVIELLFEPRVQVAQLVEIDSQFNKVFNGQFKVVGIQHNGIISDSVGGAAKTKLELALGDKLLGELKAV